MANEKDGNAAMRAAQAVIALRRNQEQVFSDEAYKLAGIAGPFLNNPPAWHDPEAAVAKAFDLLVHCEDLLIKNR